ncbi:MAG: cytochrome c3 family protein [Trichloromonadaceae bacterium]
MRPITTLFMALLATFIMTACSQEKPPAQEPAQTAPVATIPAIDAAQQAAEEAKQRVEETAAAARTEAEKSVAEVKEQAAEVKVQAAEVKVQAAAAAAAKGPKVVNYEGSMGKVTFDHAGHAENMACSKCHPTEPAVTIVMNKEVGHTLCKDCHQSSGGNAPTSCAGCHVK